MEGDQESILTKRLRTKEVRAGQLCEKIAKVAANPSSETFQDDIQSLLFGLRIYENGLKNLQSLSKSGKQECEIHEFEKEEIGSSINAARANISKLKTLFKEAQIEQQNQEEYDVLAKNINNFPSREQSQKEMQAIQESLSNIHHVQQNKRREVVRRQKQFSLLLCALNEIKSELSNEDLFPEQRVDSSVFEE
eukprot:GCRY01001481.1.p1 GENE.GCRY01001481.1~~GCRY01001481.1.p1  ORF type:complete len:193 (+),score=23.22 GCRY01001481.1:188-766(+)